MNYCQFENSYNELLKARDKYSDCDFETLSQSELKYLTMLLKLCDELSFAFEEDLEDIELILNKKRDTNVP